MNLENSFAVITEYNNRTLGFLVSSVERIVNLNWEAILPPPRGAGRDHYLTAVTHIDNKLVEIIDVEKVLAEVAPTSEEVSPEVVDDDTRAKALSCRVPVVDDSSVARKQITRCLENIGIEVVKLNDGREALNYLKRMADEGKNPAEEFLMMISDIEMPEMDGYTLTTEVRHDPRMHAMHILLHTSLSGVFNQNMVKRVGRTIFSPSSSPTISPLVWSSGFERRMQTEAGPHGYDGEALLVSVDLDFEQFRVFLEKTCGILLGNNKQYLVSSRLNKLMEQQGIKTLGDLVRKIRAQPRSGLREQVVDAMTTNETLWFRDTYPFDVLKSRVLPEMLKSGSGQRLRIWSAACSSGQEPYSLSMAIDEYERSNPSQPKTGIQIVATELSGTMLAACKAAEYDSPAIARGLSSERLQRYFDLKAPGRWVVKPAIRARVEFKAQNLLDSYAALGKFDIVFCRNVLIYFSADVKRDILKRIHATLRPGGYLFLGASEALNGLPELYQMVQCSPGIIYKAK